MFSLVITCCIFSPDSQDFESDFPEIVNGVSPNDLGFDYVLRMSATGVMSLVSYVEFDSSYFELNGVEISTIFIEDTTHGHWSCYLDEDELSIVPDLQPNFEIDYSWIINGNNFNETIVIPLIDECVFNEPAIDEDMYIEWEEAEDPQLHTLSVYNYFSPIKHWELQPSKRSFTIDKSNFPVEDQRPVWPYTHTVFLSAIHFDLFERCLIYARSTHSYGWDPEERSK